MSFVYLRKNIQENWGKISFLGAFYIVVGLMAVTFAGIATFASIALLGVCLAVVGVAEIYFGVQTRHEGRAWYHYLFGALAIACGAFMFISPVANALVITWAAAIYLMVRSVVQILGSAIERYRYWGWSFVNGIIAALFAGTILYMWPLSSFWMIGLLVGVALMAHGAEFLTLAALGRQLSKRERRDYYPPGASADPHLNTKTVPDKTKPSDQDIQNFY